MEKVACRESERAWITFGFNAEDNGHGPFLGNFHRPVRHSDVFFSHRLFQFRKCYPITYERLFGYVDAKQLEIIS
jgi:hypothetical protein